MTAIATDSPHQLPVATGLPMLDTAAMTQWLLAPGERFAHPPENDT